MRGDREGLDQRSRFIRDGINDGVDLLVEFAIWAQDVFGETSKRSGSRSIASGEERIGVDALAHLDVRHVLALGNHTRNDFMPELTPRCDAMGAGTMQVDCDI